MSATQFPLNSFSNHRRTEAVLELDAQEAGLDDLDDFAVLLSPVRVALTADRHDEEVMIHFHVSGEVEVPCRYCLDSIRIPVHTQMRVLYRPERLRPDYWEDEEEVGLGYYRQGIIDIREDLRRYLILEVPVWPVCREDCKGLCPRCGANRNRERCDCAPQTGRRTQLAEALDRLFAKGAGA
ncbi:MAG: hypothetical protein KatS3mg115_0317 [Candidatus Poribacteria bacterium]|nr:MAG: hypothetical protein KatS3mg115_0317 [Candidatus Poribacteria bacterium]